MNYKIYNNAVTRNGFIFFVCRLEYCYKVSFTHSIHHAYSFHLYGRVHRYYYFLFKISFSFYSTRLIIFYYYYFFLIEKTRNLIYI